MIMRRRKIFRVLLFICYPIVIFISFNILKPRQANKGKGYVAAQNGLTSEQQLENQNNIVILNSNLMEVTETTPDLIDLSSLLERENADDSGENEWKLEKENIPELSILLGEKKNGPKQYKSNCAKYPDLYTVKFSNAHWQVQETVNETYFLYSAYLDVRGQKSEIAILSQAKVRILGMSETPHLFTANNSTLKVCQFWFPDESKPVFGKVTECSFIWKIYWNLNGHYYPYLITCQLPKGIKKVPMSVSLVTNQCDHATNNLKIIHRERINQTLEERTPKKNFAVCVKALDYPYPDALMLVKLVEWIEMLRILGADKIFFYEYFVNEKIKKVLDMYEQQGVIDVTQITLPGELPNQPQIRHLYIRGKRLDKRLTELIPYNDCLYKNMYDYKYVVVVDTDELILPVEDMTWSELINVINRDDIRKKTSVPVSSYCFKNFYFLDEMMTGKESEVAEIPTPLHILRHVYRSTESTGNVFIKCMHSTEFTVGVHNHFPFFCNYNGRCKIHDVDEKRAQMNHYRSTCVKNISSSNKNCSEYLLETVKDDKLWRYKDELIKRVKTIFTPKKDAMNHYAPN